jgi:hypothetical protein
MMGFHVQQIAETQVRHPVRTAARSAAVQTWDRYRRPRLLRSRIAASGLRDDNWGNAAMDFKDFVCPETLV